MIAFPGLSTVVIVNWSFEQVLIMYASFTFLTNQFQRSRMADSMKSMEASEVDDTSAILQPIPKEEQSVSPLMEMMGIQSNEIPQFPEYDVQGRPLRVHKCTFTKGQRMSLHVYLTDSEAVPEFFEDPEEPDAPKLVWHEDGLVFGGATEDLTRNRTLELPVSRELQSNGSAWAHVYLTKENYPHKPQMIGSYSIDRYPKSNTLLLLGPVREGFNSGKVDPEDRRFNHGAVSYRKVQLNKLLPKPKKKNVQYLVTDSSKTKEGNVGGDGKGYCDATCAADEAARSGGDAGADVDTDEDEDGDEDEDEGQMLNYWKPTLTLSQVDYAAVFHRNHIPSIFAGHITFQNMTGNYHPIMYVNEFWLQKKHLVPLNSSVETVSLDMSISPMWIFQFQLMVQLENQWSAQAKLGLSEDGEEDSVREILAETNPIILGITILVSVLHSIFNFLAFKNDISFWRDKKRSLEGISVRGMLVNLFFQVAIFLYLMDNNTTYMILVTNAIGLAIEVWKVGKFMVGRLDWGGQDGQPPRTFPRFVVRAKETYRKSKTKEFDDMATAHLLYVVIPLMVGYAAYSLLYQQHKGWYSWLLTSVVGFIYMFGFVMMTPQLFINYKLKSVAHMPWKVMTYKSINTFIDDLFAFIVPMPTLHRLACFRDDIIFFVFLYQRYLYPVDKTRRNEYGQSAKSEEDANKVQEARAETEPREARVPRRAKR